MKKLKKIGPKESEKVSSEIDIEKLEKIEREHAEEIRDVSTEIPSENLGSETNKEIPKGSVEEF